MLNDRGVTKRVMYPPGAIDEGVWGFYKQEPPGGQLKTLSDIGGTARQKKGLRIEELLLTHPAP